MSPNIRMLGMSLGCNFEKKYLRCGEVEKRDGDFDGDLLGWFEGDGVGNGDLAFGRSEGNSVIGLHEGKFVGIFDVDISVGASEKADGVKVG